MGRNEKTQIFVLTSSQDNRKFLALPNVTIIISDSEKRGRDRPWTKGRKECTGRRMSKEDVGQRGIWGMSRKRFASENTCLFFLLLENYVGGTAIDLPAVDRLGGRAVNGRCVAAHTRVWWLGIVEPLRRRRVATRFQITTTTAPAKRQTNGHGFNLHIQPKRISTSITQVLGWREVAWHNHWWVSGSR